MVQLCAQSFGYLEKSLSLSKCLRLLFFYFPRWGLDAFSLLCCIPHKGNDKNALNGASPSSPSQTSLLYYGSRRHSSIALSFRGCVLHWKILGSKDKKMWWDGCLFLPNNGALTSTEGFCPQRKNYQSAIIWKSVFIFKKRKRSNLSPICPKKIFPADCYCLFPRISFPDFPSLETGLYHSK